MKLRRGFLFLLLVLVMVLGAVLFISCGKAESKKTDPAVEDKTEAVEKKEDTEEDKESPKEGSIKKEDGEETTETRQPEADTSAEITVDARPYTEVEPHSGWTTDAVAFRERPSTEAEKFAVLKKGTEVQIKGEMTGWYYVFQNGKEGYVSRDYVTETKAEAMEEAKAPEETAAVPRTNNGGSHVVVIDPGHQRSGDSTTEPNGPGSGTMKARVTSGTRGTTSGVAEFELNLTVGLQLKTELQNRGYTVYMTRETHDINISNKERAQYATSVGAEIAVRIHANGSENSGVNGALTMAPSANNPYIANLSAESTRLSKCIIDSYCTATGFKNLGVTATDTMTGINWSTVPVTIIEMGFMSNPTDDTNMNSPAMQVKMVQGIADGIDAYFGS